MLANVGNFSWNLNLGGLSLFCMGARSVVFLLQGCKSNYKTLKEAQCFLLLLLLFLKSLIVTIQTEYGQHCLELLLPLFWCSQLFSTVTSVGLEQKWRKKWRFPARSTQDDIFIDEPSHSPIVSEVSAACLFLFQPFLPSENPFVITIFVLAPAFPVEDSREQVPLCTNPSDGATSTGETLETPWLSCLSGGFLLCYRFSSLQSCWATAGSLRNLQDADVSG